MAGEGKRVAVISPDGKFGTIDEKFADEIIKAGGRVLSKQQAAQQQLEAEYDQQSLGQKALGYAKFAGPAGALANVVGEAVTGKAGQAAPTAEAYREGTKSGATAGVAQAAERGIRDATGSTGKAYADHLSALETAHPEAYTAGQVAGMVGGALAGGGAGAPSAGAKALLGEGGVAAVEMLGKAPGAIGALGEAAGGATARALGGLAARGVAGKAAATAAELGVRGAVESGAYTGIQHAADILTHDPERAGEKLFSAHGLLDWGKEIGTAAGVGLLGGAALGGAGSLAASGVRETGSALARVMRRGGEAVAEAGEGVGAKVGEAAERAAAHPETTSARSVLRGLTTQEGTKGLAYDRAWSSLGGGFGLQSTTFAQRAAKYLPNKTRDVGEWLMRKGVLNPEAGIIDAARAGTPDAMIPKIQAAVEADGRRIGEITGASGGTITSGQLADSFNAIASEYEKAGATRGIGREIRKLSADILDSLGALSPEGRAIQNKSLAVQDVLRERKALDSMLFDTNTVNPKLAQRVKEQLRGQMEGHVVSALDEASGRLKGELAAEYKSLKKDYLAGMIALETAEDSANRAAKAGFFGLKDLVAGGGSVVKTAASKLVRVHGDAVMASQLYQAAERGTLAKWVNRVDDQIGKASKGLLGPPAKGLPKASERMPSPKVLSKTALTKIAEFQANPEGYIDRASRQTESVAGHSPDVANVLVQKQVQAMAFLASKVPVSPDPDPLDPHPAPQMTPGEQASLARYWWYAEKPSRFFAEVARGKITPEGAETAQALMPLAFEQLQAQTIEALSDQLAKGVRLPFRQRLLIGSLMDVAATPSQRPDHARFLQKNVLALDEPPPPPPAPRRTAATPNQQRSSYDRLEADGPGRR